MKKYEEYQSFTDKREMLMSHTFLYNSATKGNRIMYGQDGGYGRVNPLISSLLGGIENTQEWGKTLGVQYEK